MLKKNEVIKILENGGYIYMQGQPQSAYVYSVSDGLLGRCRHDMAQRLAELAKYEAIPDEDGGNWYRICDPYAVAAEKAAAAHELSHIRTPGEITLRAKNDCRIGGQYVAKGRTYVVTVYGDGTQATPRNAYGSLYDFRTHEHAVYFEIIERPAEPEQQPETAAEADPQDAAPVKVYSNHRTDECTGRASVALGWHRAGDAVEVHTRDAYWGELLHRVTIAGAPQVTTREEDENRAHCRRIALELDAYVSSEVKRCPDCGEIHRRDWGEVGDAFKCPSCGAVASVDDWECLGVYDFLADALDIEYIVSGRARDALRAVRVMVAYGGPTIYIDTDSGNVELYWWNERARYALSSYALDAVNEWAAEMWGCM